MKCSNPTAKACARPEVVFGLDTVPAILWCSTQISGHYWNTGRSFLSVINMTVLVLVYAAIAAALVI
jgi:hypothetical protein